MAVSLILEMGPLGMRSVTGEFDQPISNRESVLGAAGLGAAGRESLRESLDSVLAVQLRLHALLDAVVGIGADLDLRAALNRIVGAACRLSGARYGALGVLASDGESLSDFITFGVDDATRRRIGQLPQGHGILGLLIREPKAIRLSRISDHLDSYGFPAHHPPMTSFLGVPIKIRDEVFGNLYLTEKDDSGEFTDEDEQVVSALAIAAGVVIDNARVYEVSERRRQWLEASAEIGREILGSHEPTTALSLIAQRARAGAGALFSAIVLRTGEKTSVVAAADGDGVYEPSAVTVDVTAVEAALKGKDPVLLPTADSLVSCVSDPTTELGLQEPVVLVPMSRGGEVDGVLVLVMARQSRGLGGDLDLLVSFANQAALALERAGAQRDRESLAVLADRDRIARDLHDLVIQRLFATGLQLQGAYRLAVRPDVQQRIVSAVEDLDATIHDIRTTIFEMHHLPTEKDSVRAAFTTLVSEYAQTLGYSPRLVLTGPVDAGVTGETRENLVAVARETLSNAVRHAHASSVTVEVDVDAERVALRVTDDGVGCSGVRGNGLSNMQARAESLGGSARVTDNPPHGTVVEWSVPRR